MTRIYTVTFDSTAHELPKHDPKQPLRSLTDVFVLDEQEAALARELLQSQPVGAQVYSHYLGWPVTYRNLDSATGETQCLTFKHTYVKYTNERIAAKPMRDALLGSGGFGEVKLLKDIDTKKLITAKTHYMGWYINRSNREERIATLRQKAITEQHLTRHVNGQLHDGVVDKERNPFKILCNNENQTEITVSFNNASFCYRMTADQKSAAQGRITQKSRALELAIQAKGSDVKKRKDTLARTKITIYSEFWGCNLFDFIAAYPDSIPPIFLSQLPSLISESIRILHNSFHHYDLLHLDIKLENALVMEDPETHRWSFHFCDLGSVAKINSGVGSLDRIATTRALGTWEYCSPEALLFSSLLSCVPQPPHPMANALAARQKAIVRFAETIFHAPDFSNTRCEFGTAQFCVESDIFALGMVWRRFFEGGIIKKLNTVSKEIQLKITHSIDLIVLMRHNHRLARPNLMLMQLAILPLEIFDTSLSEETLPAILQQRQLSPISLCNLNQLSDCMRKIPISFKYFEPHAFSLLKWLYAYLERQFITLENNPRDIASFVEFICYLHSRDPQGYMQFDSSMHTLQSFLDFNARIFDALERAYFNCRNTFDALQKKSVNFCWENALFTQLPRAEMPRIMSHFHRAYQHRCLSTERPPPTTVSDEVDDAIIRHVLHGVSAKVVAPISTNMNMKLFLDNANLLIELREQLEQGKSIWAVFLEAAQSGDTTHSKLLTILDVMKTSTKDVEISITDDDAKAIAHFVDQSSDTSVLALIKRGLSHHSNRSATANSPQFFPPAHSHSVQNTSVVDLKSSIRAHLNPAAVVAAAPAAVA